MRIACLQHVSFEGPGNIATWAATRGHSLRTIQLFQCQPLPRLDNFDLLVVMGGPMSIHDEADHAWLVPEKKLVTQCLEKNRFVMGVCLGSQLLAECLGSRIYRNRVKEIGWFPLRRLAGAGGSAYFAGMPEQMDVLHWHGETYDLPADCIHLADSEGCRVQAFEHPSALGLQFHLEATAEGLKDLIGHCGHEIGAGRYEQTPEKIAAGERLHRETTQAALFGILDGIGQRMKTA